MYEVVATPPDQRVRYFVQKRFLWNIIRGKDYYKMMSYHVIQMLEGKDPIGDMNDANWIIHMVLVTTKNEEVCKSFIWNIMKSVPLLTIDTIKYASDEKIKSILRSDKDIICDEHVTPFLSEIKALKAQAQADKEQLSLYQSMLETG